MNAIGDEEAKRPVPLSGNQTVKGALEIALQADSMSRGRVMKGSSGDY